MSSRASDTLLRMVDLLVSPFLRGATMRVGSRAEILATHFPVKMLLMLIDPMREPEDGIQSGQSHDECSNSVRLKLY